jgi:hypothetical protein
MATRSSTDRTQIIREAAAPLVYVQLYSPEGFINSRNRDGACHFYWQEWFRNYDVGIVGAS